jgi:hypothetical protein
MIHLYVVYGVFMGDYTLSDDEKEVLWAKRRKYQSIMEDSESSSSAINVAAKEIEYLDDVLGGKALFKPIITKVFNSNTGKWENGLL